jgi:isoleucyl-tRNA synthetase
MTLWNVYKFYEMYAEQESKKPRKQETNIESGNILDRWILARLNQLIDEVTKNMNGYDLPRAVRPIADFINDLSTWYLRRSRDRFKDDNEKDKKSALETTGFVLLELAKIMAPFMPFIAEQLWQKVSGNNFENEDRSVHLEAWPTCAKAPAGEPEMIVEEMKVVRKIVELGLAEREKAGIKIRQPLARLTINQGVANAYRLLNSEYVDLIKDEVNIKEVVFNEGDDEPEIILDLNITPELKMEGVKRELVRFINALRKDLNMTIKDKAEIYYHSDSQLVNDVFEKFGEDIKKDTLSEKIIKGVEDAGTKKEVKVDGEVVVLGIEKIK